MQLFHYPSCPHSRFVRLALGEAGLDFRLVEEKPWARRRDYLEINPSGETPTLLERFGLAIPGAATIAEYLDETYGEAMGERRLWPSLPAERVEARRLADWFGRKFHEEVARPLVHEKIYKRYMTSEEGGGGPDMAPVRAARYNVKAHLRYVGALARSRRWLAGERMSYADLAAAAQLSTVDYLGEVPWAESAAAKDWYARVKSRPSFRPLLTETSPGIPAPAHYADLDF